MSSVTATCSDSILDPRNAIPQHQYRIVFLDGHFDGAPVSGRYIGKRHVGGSWLVWKPGGVESHFGVRDHEIAVVE